jgi:hypothetical protein
MVKQFGTGIRKRNSGKHRRKLRPPSHQLLIGKRVSSAAAVGSNPAIPTTSGTLGGAIRRKRQRSDTFGLY